MSSIASLQAELSRVEARNRELRNMMYELSSGVANAHREMADYQNKMNQALGDSHRRIASSHESIIQAHEIQLEIDRMYLRFKNMELANKRIREMDNVKYYDFANYATIRKIVQGMLDNLNVSLISDEVIYKSVEKQHLLTPDYWLTSVLLSIMAWKNDDRELAERAMEISLQLDQKSTAIFYMLFNLRMKRDDAALKWFQVYQQCDLKGSDQNTFLMLFSLVNQTVQDNVNDKVKYEVSDFIHRVVEENVNAENFDGQQILNLIEQNFLRMKDSDRLQLELLKHSISDYSEMADIIVTAHNNINILQFILDVGNMEEILKNEYLDQFINEQIKKPNTAEQEVYDQIAYNETIISCGGDMDLANATFEARQTRTSNELNLTLEMTDWIYGNGSNQEAMNSQSRYNMFLLTKNFQQKAVEQYVNHYRQRVNYVHHATLGEYSSDVNFRDRQTESSKIQQFYEAERDQALSQIGNMAAIVGGVMSAAGIGLAIYLKLLPVLLLTLAGVALIAYNFIGNSKKRKHLEETCRMNIQKKNETMDALFAEFGQYMNTLMNFDSYVGRIMEALGRM